MAYMDESVQCPTDRYHLPTRLVYTYVCHYVLYTVNIYNIIYRHDEEDLRYFEQKTLIFKYAVFLQFTKYVATY